MARQISYTAAHPESDDPYWTTGTNEDTDTPTFIEGEGGIAFMCITQWLIKHSPVEDDSTEIYTIGTDDNDLLRGTSPSCDHIHGLAGDDQMIGGPGNNVLMGGDGNDQLRGGPASDFVYGGQGNNVLSGGEGDDTFFWNVNELGGFDLVLDFQQDKDVLQFEGISAKQLSLSFNGTHSMLRVLDPNGLALKNILVENVDLVGTAPAEEALNQLLKHGIIQLSNDHGLMNTVEDREELQYPENGQALKRFNQASAPLLSEQQQDVALLSDASELTVLNRLIDQNTPPI